MKKKYPYFKAWKYGFRKDWRYLSQEELDDISQSRKKHFLKVLLIVGSLVFVGIIAGIVVCFNADIVVLRDNMEEKYYPKRQNKKKDTAYPKAKRYNIVNIYYQNGKQVNKIVEKTDTLPLQTIPNGYTNAMAMSNTAKSDEKSLILDLNDCDTLDLQMIRGIGSVFSNRICKYRDKLGGYISVSQLKEVYGMDDKRYEIIKNHFTIKNNAIKKININSANIKDLVKHPYIDYAIAKEIIIFRNNYGDYKSVDDLKNIHIMDEATFNKILPYIDVK